MSDFSLRRTQMIFTLSLITSVISLIYIFIGFRLNIDNLIYLHSICVPIYMLSAYYAKKGYLIGPRIIYLLTLTASIVIASSFLGQESGIEFMLMFSLSLPFLIFSFKSEKFYIFIFSTIPIFLWAGLYLTDFNLVFNSRGKNNIFSNVIYPIAIVSTLFLVTFQLFYYSYLNFSSLSTIHDSREDAIEASKAKSKFLSTMSHEIRTPLNAVIGLSHILGDNKPRKDQEQNIEALNYSGKILLNLLNNVLDFSKMQSTEIELDNIPTDLLSATKQIKKIHETSCLKKGITMNLEIDDDIPVVWLDIVRFNQIINNLVTNAIKFTESGNVTLRIKKQQLQNNQLTLLTEVIDTGIGIAADKKELIWEAFTQASTSTNRLYGGTGLGLPIVKSIVKTMGSEIKVDSELGKGSRFYFEVDLKIASEQELEKNIKQKDHNFKGKKVLLVEDNLINVMVAQQILEKANLTVNVAHDGLTAVTLVEKNHFDVVLMDIQMPIMDGYTASIEIRKFNQSIPILALSASVFMEVKDRMNKSGMNGFIFKPFEPRDLLTKIEEVINS